MWVEEAKPEAHPNLLCYHSLYSMLGAVERDSVPSIDVHPEHRVTSSMNMNRSWDVLVQILIIYSQVSINIAQCTL